MLEPTRHEGCDGYWMRQGLYSRYKEYYICTSCEEEKQVELSPDYIQAVEAYHERRSQRQQEATRRWLEEHPPPPPYTGRSMSVAETLVVRTYRMWSEEAYAAGFLDPAPGIVEDYLLALARAKTEGEYEEEFLDLPDVKELVECLQRGLANWKKETG